MYSIILFALSYFGITSQNCSLIDSIYAFRIKKIASEFHHYASDPYSNNNASYLSSVNESLYNKERVCAIKYIDSLNSTYTMATFQNKYLAETNNYIVTHQGRCGVCSTL